MAKLFTEEKVEITKRVEEGKTVFVYYLQQAQKLTEKKGYFYDVFNEKGIKVGYGIPK